jgi:hypothetical protein
MTEQEMLQHWQGIASQGIQIEHELRIDIERLRAQRDQLLAALDLTMLGGNHLASTLIRRLGGGFATQYPPDLDPEIALEMLDSTDTYAVWCCWAAIMNARAAMEDKP